MAAPPPPPQQESCFQRWGPYVSNRVQSPEVRLFDHQRRALQAIENFWGQGGRGTIPVEMYLQGIGRVTIKPPCVISLPTGSGKSVIAAAAPYLLRGKRVLAICPDKETTKQLAKGLKNSQPLNEKLIVKYGIVILQQAQQQGGPLPNTITGGDVRAATMNDDLGINELVITNAHKFTSTARGGAATPTWKTLERSFFDVIIVDEAHHFPSAFWSQAFYHFRQSKVVFLTATPYRSDGQLVLTGGEPAYHLPRARAVELGVIRRVLHVPIDEDTDDQVVAWTSTINQVRDLLERQEREHPLPDKDGKEQIHVAMACALKKDFADDIARLARENGLPAAPYHGNMKGQAAVMRMFKTGQIRLLIICGMLLEGFDHPPVSVVAVMTRITSNLKFSQFVGRAVRVVRGDDGVASKRGAPAYCVLHSFFNQEQRFEQYNSDRIIEAAITRAENQYINGCTMDAEDDDKDNEEDNFEEIANFDPMNE